MMEREKFTGCVIGKTKVFVKEALWMQLETARIKAHVRGWLVRKRVKEVKVLSVKLGELLEDIGATETNPKTNLLKTHRRATFVEAHFEKLVGLVDASIACPL